MEKQIDIIIPAYNAHQTIYKTLSSIASQTISDLLSVTIVNDGSERDYSECIQCFSPFLDIRELTLNKNVGCGMARQIGLDNTNAKYIMFADADDVFANPFSIFSLYTNIEKGNQGKEINIVYGSIQEVEIKTGTVKAVIPADHGTWLFGSIYRRNFIETNEIRFNNSSRGEDVSFNKICKLLSDPEQIGLINLVTYFWTDANEKRINSPIFKMLYAKAGYIENMIYVYDFLENKENHVYSADALKLDAISNFVSLYFQYLELFEELDDIRKEVSLEELTNSVTRIIDLYKELYDSTYAKYKNTISEDDISFVYNINLERMLNRGSFSIKGISFFDFLNMFDTGNHEELKNLILP